jgi:superfamily II DNA/RNA helicase
MIFRSIVTVALFLHSLDIFGAAKTGSGKISAFLIPVSWTVL